MGTRLSYFGGEYKMAEQSFHSFHEKEIRELLTKNSKNRKTTTRRITSAIWRILAHLKKPSSPKFADKHALS